MRYSLQEELEKPRCLKSFPKTRHGPSCSSISRFRGIGFDRMPHLAFTTILATWLFRETLSEQGAEILRKRGHSHQRSTTMGYLEDRIAGFPCLRSRFPVSQGPERGLLLVLNDAEWRPNHTKTARFAHKAISALYFHEASLPRHICRT